MSSGRPYNAPRCGPKVPAPQGRANVALGALCDMSAPCSVATACAGRGWSPARSVAAGGLGAATTSSTPTSWAASTESAMGWLRAMRYSPAVGSK